jgi:hypothetical protein
MIGQLLADHVDPDAVAQITREVLDRVHDDPRVVAEAVAPYAQRFGLERGDGPGLLDELMSSRRARNRNAKTCITVGT